MTPAAAALLLACALAHTVHGRLPHCHFSWEMQQARRACHAQLLLEADVSSGCQGEWDNASCWPSASVGEVMTLPCPPALLHLFGKKGNLSRTCTDLGWSIVHPPITTACFQNITTQHGDLVFYRMVKILSTLGHSLSLIALLTSTIIICTFRRLRCTRNYIHLNLFVSFMLRAVAVMTKDALLFTEDENIDCSSEPSLVGCRASLVFFHYSIMANFFWLLAEGLYLHILLVVIHTYSTRLSIFMLIGWGIPFILMASWTICRIKLENTRCWEINENHIPDRLLNWPIMASVIINFILFISIIRILVQKLRCAAVGGYEKSQYRRLAKSTLLLIPLFGINYVVFVYPMELRNRAMEKLKILFDLGLGSFQGLIVAVLYCLLNSEVQGELRRTWRSFSLKRYVGRDYRLHAASVSRSGTETSAPRSSRAQSLLQTETTLL